MSIRVKLHAAFHGDDILGAVRLGDETRTIALISEGKRPVNATNADGDSLLIIALRYRYRNIAATLVACGADVSVGTRAGWSPLMSAALHGYSELVELFIQRGADVNATTVGGQNAILAAAVNGHDTCVRLLAEHGADLNAAADRLGYSPLMLAIAECSIETIKLLIALGSGVNTLSTDRMTPLRCARQQGRNDIAEILEDAGATV
jgi:hypothetical protein